MSLLSWQWDLYPSAHADRRNLAIHIFTNPIFIAGFLAVPLGLVTFSWITMIVGLLAMPLVMFIQGRGHGMEKVPPVPFRGPGDAIGRIFLEQLVNFPRYVITGGFADAWTNAGGSTDSTDSPRSSASA